MRIDNNLIDMFHEYRRHITHTLYNMSVSNMMDENRDIHKMIGYNSNLEYNLRYYSRNPIIYNLYENLAESLYEEDFERATSIRNYIRNFDEKSFNVEDLKQVDAYTYFIVDFELKNNDKFINR